MTKILLFLVIILFVALGLLVYRRGQPASTRAGGTAPSGSDTINNIKPITNNQAEIEVEVLPTNISASSTDFQVRFTTHTVDLGFDLSKQAVLEAGGAKFSPLSWDGGSGGHHLLGTLKFPPIAGNVKSFKLIITNIGTPERDFEWKL